MTKQHKAWTIFDAPDFGEEFSFHGLRVVTERFDGHDDLAHCEGCFYHTHMRALGKAVDCDNARLPACHERRFVEVGYFDENEFKLWQVLQRMGLNDDES